ncbi:YgjV family protein [Shimwellia pseudoproteus]|uniref:YgjV family protein n=1 Tax=Shimwellia pseudoproteus TaxID=570012 RepID=UPI0018EB436C|nr:YgjV family protein [Shimwellia pseudoproteus]MBJ3815356.1 YgjV family protein [Shimwellia pseudoproteus]
MNIYWLAQGIGVLAFVVGITTFFNRDERRFKLQLSLYSAIIGVHFFLMGSAPAGASAMLNSVRTVISMRTRSLWVMALFIVLTLGIGLGKMDNAMQLLPVAGTVASTWALFRCRGLTTRCVMWCATACWVVHNFWLGSIGGTLIEGSFLLINAVNILRFRRMQKRGIDPFRMEKARSG